MCPHIEMDNLAVNRNTASISHANAFYYDSADCFGIHYGGLIGVSRGGEFRWQCAMC